MHLESHAGVGWFLGVAAPETDRRLRNWCLAAAILPDIDAAAFFFGPQAYSRWHHTFGHNVFLGAAVVALAAWSHRDRGRQRMLLASVLVAVAFASHLATDAKLSAYAVYLFWPLSSRGYEFSPNLGLGAPINTWLAYLSYASVPLLALWRGVTPVDVFSPALDRVLRGVLSPRRRRCADCGGSCNQQCGRCAGAVCFRHAVLDRRLRVTCASCAAPIAGQPITTS